MPSPTPPESRFSSLALALVTLSLFCGGFARAQISVGGDPSVVPADFRITVFAAGLTYPTSMQLLDDGSLLVLTNDPITGLFTSSGEIVRLVDADGNGVADGAASSLYSGLPGIATSMRKSGDLIFVSSREFDDETISVLRVGATPGSALTLVGTMDLTYPTAAVVTNHRNVALAIRATPGQGGKTDVLFNIGSESNSTATTGTVSGGGLLSGVSGASAMAMDSIYSVTVEDTGGTPVATNAVQIAAGLRNAAGIAFHPTSGDLYFQDNGIDPGSHVQTVDELNHILQTSVGGGIEDFGFPLDYIEYRTGTVATGTSVQPIVAFQPIPDPATGAESEGPVEIAFVPPGFPQSLQGGVFVGFHGEFSKAGTNNGENPVVYVDLATNDHFHFVSNTEPSLGHPNGLLATNDSLFIADLTSTGSTGSNAANGVIHQIQGPGVPIPVLPWRGLPAAIAASVFGVALFGAWIRGRRFTA